MSSQKKSAAARGLVYISDGEPGIQRRGKPGTLTYVDHRGRQVNDEKILERIRNLAIPPAWTDVWICRNPRGHLQATGRDARGRKQYRYHAQWREHRDEAKYNRLPQFAKALPRIRRAVQRDLRQRGLTREKVLAAVVQLLETTLIRVGNEEYARGNGSYGLTTFRDQHVHVNGRGVIRFDFRGKSGKRHRLLLCDPRLAKIVRGCQDLPGQVLFQYLDESGKRRSVKSADVNDYLRECCGEDFTAKDFRTWAATVLAVSALSDCEPPKTEGQAKRRVNGVIKSVSERLGNTPAICRKSYVHPGVLELFQSCADRLAQPAPPGRGLRADERKTLAFLKAAARNGSSPTRKRGKVA
jgi:DNA topoisomerase I